jgi:glycosyltransferase involved in cell wall biosynthesis
MNKQDLPKVSVIINTYNNHFGHLQEAIDSYIQQIGVDVEIIISTVEGDKSIEIANDNEIKKVVISKTPDIYKQLNKAIKSITTDWFAYASGNDVALPKKLITELNYCIQNKKKVCYSSFIITDADLNNRKTRKFYNYDYKKHLLGNFVNDCALIESNLLKKYVPFILKYKNAAYWDLWLRIAESEGDVFIYNPEPTWLYRTLPDSLRMRRKTDVTLQKANNDIKQFMLSFHGKK